MTFSTMRSHLASILKVDATIANQTTLLNRLINQGQQEIWAAYDWPWAMEREIVETAADKTAGTAAIDSAATTVTGTSTAFASGDVGKYIQFSTNADWYRITAVASATSLTIEKGFTGSSNVTGVTYTIRQLLYSLSSSVEKVLTMRQMRSPAKLELVHYRKFHHDRPYPQSTGNPTTYILYGYDSSDRWRFSPYPWPDATMNLEVLFKKKVTDLSADTDVSEIPEKWHQTVLFDAALCRALEYVRSSDNDRRSELVRQRFKEGLEQMIADYDADSDYHPRLDNPEEKASLDNIVPFPAGWG